MPERPTAAVLGLGLIGSSLALGLRGTSRYAAVTGWDPDFDTYRAAQKTGACDRYVSTAQEAVRQAAAVFLAVNAGQFRETLANVAPHLAQGAVICSLDQAHETTMQIADQQLPGNVSLVCANPVLWERVTVDTVPSASLFQRGVLALSPSPAAHPDAVAYVADLSGALGLEPYFVDAREHDAFYAGIGRLPAVLAASLLHVATRQPAWREMSRLAGGELREATAPVAVEPERQQAGLGASGEHLARWLDEVIGDLAALRDAIKDGSAPADYFTSAAEARARWLHDRQTPAAVAEQPPRGDDARPSRRGLFR